MNIYNKVKIELKSLSKVLLLIILILPVLGGCRVDESNYELTNHRGKSIESFERKTKTKLNTSSKGIYVLDGVLQLIAPKGDITSISVLEGAKDYKLFGVGIGMERSKVEPILNEIYGAEIDKTIISEKNSITYTYKDMDSELFVSYNIDSDIVTEMSYYYHEKEKEAEDEEQLNSGELIALVGDIRVYYNEAMVYLKSVQENYEKDYGKGIWDVDIFGDGKSFETYIKDEVIKQIIQLKVIRDKADKLEIFLSEEEMVDVATYADQHFRGLSDSDIDRYMVSRELLEQVYSDNILAEKAFETLTIDVDTNVSDFDSRQVTIQHILVYGTELDDEGKRIPLTIEQRENAYGKISLLLDKAKSGEDFYTLAETNSEDELIEYTFGRKNGPEKFASEFVQAAFTLKTGEISDLISTEYGWHIIYCVTDFNEDATTQVKEFIIEERRVNQFAELYSQWSSEYDVIINSDVWDGISLKY